MELVEDNNTWARVRAGIDVWGCVVGLVAVVVAVVRVVVLTAIYRAHCV